MPQFLLRTEILPFCSDNSDRCYDSTGNFKCARCLDNKTVISYNQLCDGIVDCYDMSDECPCQDSPLEILCQAVFGSFSDNIACSDVLGNKPQLVCDNNDDCYAMNLNETSLDEKFCRRPSTTKGSFQCQMNIPYKGVSLKPFNIAKKCDGIIECPFREDECDGSCTGNKKLCMLTNKPKMLCDQSSKAITEKEYCNGIHDCQDGKDEEKCSKRSDFYITKVYVTVYFTVHFKLLIHY